MSKFIGAAAKTVAMVMCALSAAFAVAQSAPVRNGLQVNMPNGFASVRVDDFNLASTGGQVRWARSWDGREWKFNPHWESLSQSWTNLTGASTGTVTGAPSATEGGSSAALTPTVTMGSSDAGSGCYVMVDEDWTPSTGTVLIDNRPPFRPMQAERISPFNKIIGESDGQGGYPQPRLVSVDYANLCAGSTGTSSTVQDMEAIRIKNELYLGEGGRYAYSNRSVLEKRAVSSLPTMTSAALETLLASGSMALTPSTIAKGFRWIDKAGQWVDYNTQGQVVAYGDENNNVVWLARDSGGMLRGVVDRHGRVLFTLHYSGKLIAEVRDYPIAGLTLDLPARSVKYEYDAGNRLRTVIDTRGHKTLYDYDATNNLTSITDQEGRITKLAYEGSSLKQMTAADGGVTDYVFEFDDANKQFTSRITGPQTPAGRMVEDLTHNRSGQLVRRVVNGRVEEEVRYDTGVRSEKHTDARGFSSTVTFNEFGQTVEVKREDGTVVQNAFSAVNLAFTQTTDANGVKTTYGYDERGNLARITEAVGTPAERIALFEVNAQGMAIKATAKGRTEANGTVSADAVTLFDYDKQGSYAKITNPENIEQIYVHDRMGNLVSITDGRKNTTVIQRDAVGNVVQIKNGLNHVWLFAYDKVGNQLTITDPDNRVTRFAYNAMNQRIERDVAGKSRSAIKYNLQGLAIVSTDGDGRKNMLEYDIFNRPSKRTDGAGNETLFSYRIPDGTESGMLGGLIGPTEIKYPLFTQRVRYDQRDRPSSFALMDPAGARTGSILYDANGALKSAVDAYGKNDKWQYDALGSMTLATDRLGRKTEFLYDVHGNMLRITDARRSATQFEYDLNGNVIKELLPLGQVKTTKFDKAGNAEEITDALGNRTAFTFDEANRPKQALYYDAAKALQRTVIYGWDKTRLLTAWTVTENGAGASGVRSFDEAGRLSGETVTYPGGFQMGYTYTYSVGDKLTKLIWPDGTELNYAYSVHGQLSSVTIPGEGSLSIDRFNWVLPASTILPGGAVQEREFDVGLGLKKMKVRSPDQRTLLDFGQAYGAENEPKSSTRYDLDSSTVAQSYSYDDELRLTGVSSNTGGVVDTELFTLDEVANRKTHSRMQGTWIYDSNNRLTERGSGAGVIRYAYDDAGNLIRKTEPGAVVTHFGYNAANRLVFVKNSAQQLVARYGYDALGRRMWKEQYREKSGQALAPAVRTYFLYSPDGLLAEATQAITLNADDSVTVNEVPTVSTQYGPRPGAVFMSNVLFAKTRNSNGNPMYAYFSHDARGAPIQATDKSNNIVWAAKYEAFGRAQITTQLATAELPTIAVALRLPGQYEDVETGMHQNYYRDYDPDTGRYVQTDPIGLAGGINSYAYVNGNPMSGIDPLGLDCVSANGSFSCKTPGGPSFGPLPAPKGWPTDIRKGIDGYHRYAKPTPGGNCTRADMWPELVKNPIPWRPNVATPEGADNNATPPQIQVMYEAAADIGSGGKMPSGTVGPLNPVKSYITKDHNTGNTIVVNVTQPGHTLFPGYTARVVHDSNGQSGMVTYGEGSGWLQDDENRFQWQRDMINDVWYDAQESIIDKCKCK